MPHIADRMTNGKKSHANPSLNDFLYDFDRKMMLQHKGAGGTSLKKISGLAS